ncbi:glycosyltransferase family 2 protein [Candidatus Woesearchaeota archaeon]|nr:glycosyltransferase family 2 protein [Candidatus Woesearchaeota archaeon]
MGVGMPYLVIPITMSIDIGTLAYYWTKNKLRRGSRKNEFEDVSGLYNESDSIDALISKKPKKDVTVVISAHGEEKTIEKIVLDVFKQTYPIKNIYISDSNIDNTSRIINKLSKEFPNVYYWSKDGVIGKAEKINCLVRDTNVDLGYYVYLKDSSTKLAPDVLEKLVSGFTDENVAAVTSFGFVTPPDNYLAKYFHYGKEWVNKLGKFRKTAQQYRRAMFVVCGASFMVRSDILKNIEIPIGTKTEDTAYTWRLQEEGYKVGVVQDAVVSAEDVTTLESQLKQSFRWHTGTWQNLYLHKKDLFGPHSKAKALAYSTILPGFIESTLYTATFVSLPIIYYFSPDFVEYFLIGDTALSFASPLISMPLGGNPEETPKEFFKTLRHYHQITAYKAMSSALWLSSGVKVAYDILSGKSEKWTDTWSILK